MKRYGLPEDIITDIIRATTGAIMPVRAQCKVDGQLYFVYRLDIFGTTYSGHPTKTTWGNTIRTILYACFVHSLKYANRVVTRLYNSTRRTHFD